MGLTKKTMELDDRAVQKLRIIFGVKTDKEAVNRAISLVAEEDDIIKTHESLAGKLEFEPAFS